MTDLRALLYEPWCCESEVTLARSRKPLATRLPECVPPGLGWNPWNARHIGTTDTITASWVLDGNDTTAATAELLFIGKAVKVLLNAEPQLNKPDLSDFRSIHLLAAALHRLADEKERGDDRHDR